MPFSESVIRWSFGLCLDLAVPIVAVRNGLFKRLPVFTLYLIVVGVFDVITTTIRASFPHSPILVFYEYWIAQAIMVGLRATAVADICYRIISPYQGVWRLCRLVLAAVGAVLLVAAGVAAARQPNSMTAFITTLQRGVELAIVGTLAFGLLFAVYYRLRIERFMSLIIAGLLFYSAVQIGNSEYMSTLRARYFEFYSSLSLVSYNIAALIWLVAVWKPIPAAQPAQVLQPVSGEEIAAASATEVNARLRELNSRLSEILR